MNKVLEYNVTGQSIELSSTAMLVAGTVNEYTAKFAFSADWDGYQRVAVFNADGTEREQLLTDGTCKVPWEVLLPGAYLKVGVYGTKDGSRLPTIWTSHRQYIHDGAGPTDEAADPSPVLAEQILQRMGDLDTLKTEDKSSLVAAINEILMSGGGGASVTDAAIDENGHLIITLSTGKTIDAGYAVGPAGPAGKDGKDGADGLSGKDGKDGSPGADGQDGVGIQSVTQTTTSTEDGGTNIVTVTKTDGTTSTFEVRNGRRGATGPAGADGKDGKDGSQGPAGADGKTAYQYAQDGGYTGTEAEFAAKLAAEIPDPYTLPIANSTTLGGVKPVAKTAEMTQPCGVAPDGGLWTKAASGGGSSKLKLLIDQDITEDVSSVLWSVGDNPQLAGLTFILLHIKFPSATKSGWVKLAAGVDVIGFANLSSVLHAFGVADGSSGKWAYNVSTSTNNAAGVNCSAPFWRYNYTRGVDNPDCVDYTEIKLYGNNLTIHAGSKIRLWGC